MKKIIVLILCLLPLAIFAQSATDYFHTAANFYVNANKKSAKSSVQEGIRKFPDNQKLKTLAAKIDQLPDPEDDQNPQNQNQQNQEQQGGQDKEDKNKQDKQQQAAAQQQKEEAKRQLDALQQNEKRTQEKAKELENRQTKSVRQEKDW